ncbi:FHA domain containing protein [Novymonas esmeraldas]|uniref:FHA domain containing protein n=1 Tax=Novymonas esmeraldas TaxID=1808958 RepID=A0AAW0EWT9_9TRYP
MGDNVNLDFVLVRGPASLDRRMRVALPCNGAPVTLGRATHCTALLDPSLLFSSQVQCSLLAMRTKSAAASSPTAPHDGLITPTHGTASKAKSPDQSTPAAAADYSDTPLHRSTHAGHAATTTTTTATVRVYVTDMCSSNGTFVNGVRISGTDPTELKHGDVCIFGGMRDVDVGESLPADAYQGPELVLWRVDMHSSPEQPPEAFDYTATPLVLPARDVLEAEERALLHTVQRSFATAARPLLLGMETPTSAAAAEAGRESVSASVAQAARPPDADADDHVRVPQRLFTSPAPHVGGAAVLAAGEELRSASHSRHTSVGRRSVSLVADAEEAVPALVPDSLVAAAAATAECALDASPPAAVLYRMIRLGNVTYDARDGERQTDVSSDADDGANAEDADAAPLAPPSKRPRAGTDRRTTAVPPQLTCTPTHLMWTMPNPNDMYAQRRCCTPADDSAKAGNSFYGLLPVTSLATVVACPARLGLAVELRDGCQLPRVDAAVLSGSAESRWVVWVLSEREPRSTAPVAPAPDSGSRAARKRAKVAKCGTHTAAAHVGTGAGGDSTAAESPLVRFEAWLACFQRCYAAQHVPAPVMVDAAAFDVLVAPPLSPTITGVAQQL